MVAVVGSRRSTPQGDELAFQIAFGLARAGAIVVSGLALGIDSWAHRGALRGGRTVAVMGTGPDIIYPYRNRRLAEEIAGQGALVTQFPVGAAPNGFNFPIRNETISGLCLGVVVVEARVQSGAMLTAGAAGVQGRAVMAVPGSVSNPNAAGCHALIRDGARLVTCAAEVLAELQGDALLGVLEAESGGPKTHPAYGDTRDQVLDVLRGGPLTLDQVCAHVGGAVQGVATAASRLRLDHRIELRDGLYSLLGNSLG
jgi:DNA processing protein